MMSLLALAETQSLGQQVAHVLKCPVFWAIVCGASGLFILVPPQVKRMKTFGIVLLAAALGLFVFDVVRAYGAGSELAPQITFWTMAAVALAGGVGLIASQNPVYSAIWFAFSLIGTAGIFLLQHAWFLGVATIIVYAGAIVVTFLFVLMLAQPEGHAVADRISWGHAPKLFGIVAASLLIGMIAGNLHTPAKGTLRDQLGAEYPLLEPDLVKVEVGGEKDGVREVKLYLRGVERPLPAESSDLEHSLQPVVGSSKSVNITPVFVSDVRHSAHMARLGGYLFSRQLIALEVAGTLLLAALVGAVAMLTHAKLSRESAV